jgi:hypothetical protein
MGRGSGSDEEVMLILSEGGKGGACFGSLFESVQVLCGLGWLVGCMFCEVWI